MAELSEVLGALMVSLVHARRMADEETAAVAEYYKDHPLLEGMSLPRVRVPELNISMPVTIDDHVEASEAKIDSPTNILRAVSSQLSNSSKEENIDSRKASEFRNIFNAEAKTSLAKLNELQRRNPGRVSKEAVVRAVDDALKTSMKKTKLDQELSPDSKANLSRTMRHTVSSVALKQTSTPMSLKASAVTSEVKEKATKESSVHLSITLREEGLEWSTSQGDNGDIRSRLQPE